MSGYDWNNNVKLETVFDRYIVVPKYQREYSWGYQEADDFFEDLKKFSDSTDEEYLFGQFIFCKNGANNTIDVIDGQQRLVTTVIFLSVLRSKVDGLQIDPRRVEFISFYNWIYKIIGNDSTGDYKLTLNGKARSYFERNIQKKGGPTTSGRYKAMKNIKSVYDLFKDKIEKYLNGCKDDNEQFEKIYHLTKTLLEKFRLSTITTEDLGQAYTIFETLNARGKDLEASDLLKNYFFSKGNEEIEDNWNEAMSDLADLGESLTQFIRVYWNSKEEFIRQREVHRTITKELKETKKILKFVEGLNRVSKYYLSMVAPDSNNEFRNSKIKGVLTNLKSLGTRLFYPMILASVETNAEPAQILNLLTAIETLTIRNIVVGPGAANQFEKLFSEYAIDINKGTRTIDDVINLIKQQTDPDEKFEHYFETVTIKDTKVSRLMLLAIYNYENGKENVINPDPTEVNVEHIMPVIKSQWPEITNQDHEMYLYYLGNQTLLKAADNTKISNDPFDVKKKTYSLSTIPQNRYFEDISVWNPEEIEKRQKQLVKTAVKCWRI